MVKKTKDLAYFVYSCYEYLKIIPLDIIKKGSALIIKCESRCKDAEKTNSHRIYPVLNRCEQPKEDSQYMSLADAFTNWRENV